MKTVICRRCGARIEPEAARCPACGAKQKRKTEISGAGEMRAAGKNAAGRRRQKAPARGLMRHRAAPYIVGAAALLAAVTVLLCVLGGVFDFVGSSAEKMPDVVGQTEANARQMLEALQLRVAVKTVSDAEAAGVVIAQSIPEGRALKGNQSVTLTVSDGSAAAREETDEPETEMLPVPGVVGMDFADAQRYAEQSGLNLAAETEQYSDKPEGTVLWQEPAAGETLRRGEAIRVAVSLGPENAEFTVTVTAGKGGSVSPDGRVTVPEGEDAVFVITPDAGYAVSEVKIDGEDVGPVEEYTFAALDADHTLYAVFRVSGEADEADGGEKPPAPPEPSTPSDIAD